MPILAEGLRFLELDRHQRIARLDRLLGDFPSLLVNIEVKPLGLRYAYPAVAAVAREVKRARAADRVVVSSFDPVVVGLCRRTTRLCTGLLFHAEQGMVLRRAWLAPALAPHAVHPEQLVCTQAQNVQRVRVEFLQTAAGMMDDVMIEPAAQAVLDDLKRLLREEEPCTSER